MPLCLMTCNVMMSVGIPCYQVSLVVSGSSFWFEHLGSNPAVTTGGHLRSRVQKDVVIGTSALCDLKTHQPVVALDY